MRLAIIFWVVIFSGLTFAEPVAVVVRAGGDVTRTDLNDENSNLKRRDTLTEGDRVQTGAGAYLTLKFTDQSVVEIGENSALSITRFRETADDGQKILLELLSGKLRTVTGALAKEPDAFNLQTAHASIGVRGTAFEVLVLSDSETQVLRHDGEVIVRSREFLGQELILDEANVAASATLEAPAQYIEALGEEPMGDFDAAFLTDISAIPIVAPPAAVPALAIVSLSGGGATPVSDEDEEDLGPIEALVALVNAGRWSEADVLANELRDRYEGLPRFDLYYGLVLMQKAEYEEAIFAFERVLIFVPDQHRARLELGRAYYQLGNYARARSALEQVLLADPPSNVRRNVNTLLALITEEEARSQIQTEFGGSVEAGWDSNANGGSNLDGDLDPNLLGLTELATASTPVSSIYTQWSVTTGFTQPTSQFASNQVLVDFTTKNYVESSLNDTSALTFSTSLTGQSNRWRTQLPLAAQWSWLDGRSWQAMVDAGFTQQYKVWGPLWVGVKIGTQVNVAMNEDNVTNAKDLAGLVFDAQERGRVHSFSSLYLQTLQAGQDDENVEWRGLANRYQLSWTLPWRLRANLSAEHQWRRYKGEDLFFTVDDSSTELKLRQDQVLMSDLQIGWAPSPWLETQTRFAWEWVDSNINVYGRERMTLSQTVSVRF